MPCCAAVMPLAGDSRGCNPFRGGLSSGVCNGYLAAEFLGGMAEETGTLQFSVRRYSGSTLR